MNAVGIDLGTTNTVCCYINDSQGFSTIRFDGQEVLPSALLYERGKITIGKNAKQKSVISNQRYIESSKTLMGITDPIKTIDDRSFNSTDVATEILKRIKTSISEQANPNDEIHAVITIPAYFESNQKRETKKAGEDAGFIVDAIIHEPSAAAIAYGTINPDFKNMYIIDIGGGTFDVAYIKKNIKSDGSTEYEEKIVHGDHRLGGNDFNMVIYDMILNHILGDCGVDLSSYDNCCDSIKNENTFMNLSQKLKNLSEDIKIALSELQEYKVEIPALFNNEILRSPYNLEYTITRSDFERKASSIFEKIKNIIRQSFEDPDKNSENYKPQDIEKVLFMGGSSSIPKLREIAVDFFGKEPIQNIDISKGVAMGAAMVAYNKKNQRENITSIRKNIVLQEILAHSLGVSSWINNIPGQFSEILKQGSKYPVKNTRSYYTLIDNQENMHFRILEGNSRFEIENTYYTDFTFHDITPMPAGKARVDLICECDNDGILQVTAVEHGTSKNQKVSVDISKSYTHPFLQKYSKKYNIILLPCMSNNYKASSIDSIKKDMRYQIMSTIHSDLCIFNNPSALLYNGRKHTLTTNIAEFAKTADDYFDNNFINVNKFAENLGYVTEIIDDSKNTVLIIITNTDLSGNSGNHKIHEFELMGMKVYIIDSSRKSKNRNIIINTKNYLSVENEDEIGDKLYYISQRLIDSAEQ